MGPCPRHCTRRPGRRRLSRAAGAHHGRWSAHWSALALIRETPFRALGLLAGSERGVGLTKGWTRSVSMMRVVHSQQHDVRVCGVLGRERAVLNSVSVVLWCVWPAQRTENRCLSLGVCVMCRGLRR